MGNIFSFLQILNYFIVFSYYFTSSLTTIPDQDQAFGSEWS